MSLAYRKAAEEAGWTEGDDPRLFVDPVDFTRCRCGPVVTKQAFRDQCDVNLIVQAFDKDGVLSSHLNPATPVFMDVSAVPDYRTAIEHVRAADAFFQQLPAKTREHFRNDPAEFLDALSDGARYDELRELGLVEERREPEAPAAPPAPPTQ